MNLLDRIEALPAGQRRELVDVLLREGHRYGVHPLTPAQQRMWLLTQLRPDSPVYNVCFRAELAGDVDAGALERALDTVVAQHDALRTVFVPLDGEPRQLVHPHQPGRIRLDVHDFTGASAPAARAAELADATARRPFDLARGPLVRAALARVGRTDWVLVLTLHHIVCDGWSMPLVYADLGRAYAAYRSGSMPSLPDRPPAIGVALRQHELAARHRDRQLRYWRQALAGAPSQVELPLDRARPALLDDAGNQLSFRWSAEVAAGVAALARRARATPFMVLQAAFAALLHRYGNPDDVLVATPVAGRAGVAAEAVVGFFANTVVLRSRPRAQMSFTELLAEVRDTALAALTHQELPFDVLVDDLRPGRDLGNQPLAQVMLAVEDGDAERLELDGLRVRCAEYPTGTAKFDLTLILTTHPDRVEGRLEYRTQLFDPVTAQRIADHLGTLLAAAVADPDRRLADLPMLTAGERAELTAWHDTRPPAGDVRPVTTLFEARVDAAPDAPAAAHRDRVLSYRDLDHRANRLAHLLRARGVGPETPVGVRLPAGLDLVTAFLGVLKAGGVYVPLDPQLPTPRLRQLATDAGVVVTLIAGRDESDGPDTIDLAADPDPTAGHPPTRPPVTVRPDSAAYLIYTSGSTGRPKGVVGTHAGLRNLADAQRDLIGVRPQDRVLQFHSPGFDVCVSDLVTALTAGALLRLIDRHERQPGPDLAAAINRYGITVADLPPVALGAMTPADVPGLRSLTVGGEACPVDLARTWSATVEFHNAYGPTETSVTATVGGYVEGAASVPIGRPVTGARAYVLDAGLNPVAVGVPGELFVGGPGVARGYQGDAALTAQRFLPDPFAPGGARMYRTGDIVRYRADGTLEFLGRADAQVKVRGHRIEPGEIEARLRRCPGVRRCAVVVREDRPGDRRLVAYLVGDPVRGDALRRELSGDLPGYLVPAAFVQVDDLPLTPSGKLDVRALPAPSVERPVLDITYAAPGDALEETVAAVWRDLLGLAQVGVHDNFFDLGGNSLLLAKVKARLSEVVGTDIPAVELFRHPTVATLARYLASPEPTTPAGPARDRQLDERRRALAQRAGRRAGGRRQDSEAA